MLQHVSPITFHYFVILIMLVDSVLRCFGLIVSDCCFVMKCSTTVFSHSQTVVVCGNCQTVLCQPTGGRARLTEGCSFRRKGDWRCGSLFLFTGMKWQSLFWSWYIYFSCTVPDLIMLSPKLIIFGFRDFWFCLKDEFHVLNF